MTANASIGKRLRRTGAILVLDGIRLAGRLIAGRWSGQETWIRMRNRMDRLISAPDGPGVTCDWKWSRDLAVCREFPAAGTWLMREALRFHPVDLKDPVELRTAAPEVSFVIGHRGRDRLPQLLATIRSLAGQVDVRSEIIVVEQSNEPILANLLPERIRLLETRTPPGAAYNRSAAFNAGVLAAKAPVVILHDGDILAPRDYALRALHRIREGFDFVDMKRFVFYLNEVASARAARAGIVDGGVEAAVQNLLGGGSVAARKDAYLAIGGFDEEFVGWGGEDEEFWDRASTRRVWAFAELPFVHLWHAPQPMKRSPENPTANLLRKRLATPAVARIAELVSLLESERIRK